MDNNGFDEFRKVHKLVEENGLIRCMCGVKGDGTLNTFVQHLINEWMGGFNPGFLEGRNSGIKQTN